MKRLPNGSIKLDEVDQELLLSMKDGPKSRRELVLLAPTKRIGERRIETFLKYGLIQRVRQGVYGLTSKGKNYIKKLTPTVAVTLNDPKLQVLIDLLPTEAHRAIFRLILSGIVAKYLYFKFFDNNWPASIIIGPTKTFKSGLIEVTCKIVKGLDFTRNNYYLYRGTPGDIGLRRFRTKGKKGYDVSKSYLFNEKLASFDEWDKASSELKQVALSFADGRREFMVEEGRKVVNHAYPVIMGNTTPKGLEIPDYIIRRSIVVNTDFIKDQLTDIDLRARDIFSLLESPKTPKIDLSQLPAIRTKLSENEFLFMRNLFMENVVEGYKGLVDTKPLEILILGRLSLLGTEDVKEVIFQTVWDRLECLETMEGAKDGWRKRVNDSWLQYRSIEQPQVLARIKEAEEEGRERKEKIEKTKEQVIRQKVEKEMESVSLVGYKETVKSKFKELKNPLPDPKKRRWQTRISPFYKMLSKALDQINGKSTTEEISTYEKKVYLKLKQKRNILLEEIKEIEDEEERLREEEKHKQDKFKKEKSRVKEQYETLKKLFKTYAKLTGGMAEDHNQQNERHLKSLFSQMEEAKDIDTLTSISSVIGKDIEDVNAWIEEKETEKERKKREEEGRRREQEQNKKLQLIQNKKEQILEKWRRDVFDSKYLSPQEKAELGILEKYYKRKKAPVDDVASFLKNLGLIKWVNFYNERAKNPGSEGAHLILTIGSLFSKTMENAINRWGYLGIDNKEYSQFYFKDNWDAVLPLIQVRIHQIKKMAIQKRKNKLAEEWKNLDKLEQNLKPHF